MTERLAKRMLYYMEEEAKTHSKPTLDFLCDILYAEQRLSRICIRTMKIMAKEDAKNSSPTGESGSPEAPTDATQPVRRRGKGTNHQRQPRTQEHKAYSLVE